MFTLYQGTTGYLGCNVWGADLTDARACVVSVECGQLYNFDLSRMTIAYDSEAEDSGLTGVSAIVIHLTQVETLAFRDAIGKIQVRWIDAMGETQTTNIESIEIGKSLYRGVLK